MSDDPNFSNFINSIEPSRYIRVVSLIFTKINQITDVEVKDDIDNWYLPRADELLGIIL